MTNSHLYSTMIPLMGISNSYLKCISSKYNIQYATLACAYMYKYMFTSHGYKRHNLCYGLL